jgi:hypothetical protein
MLIFAEGGKPENPEKKREKEGWKERRKEGK